MVACVIGRDDELDAVGTFLHTPKVREERFCWRTSGDREDDSLASRRSTTPSSGASASSRARRPSLRRSCPSALRDLLDVAFDEVADRLPPPQRPRTAGGAASRRAGRVGSGAGGRRGSVLTVLRELASRTRLLVAMRRRPVARLCVGARSSSSRRGDWSMNRCGCFSRLVARATRLRLISFVPRRSRAPHRDRTAHLGASSMLHERLGRAFARPALRRIHDEAAAIRSSRWGSRVRRRTG